MWVEFTQLSLHFKAINLSHGKPGVCPPQEFLKNLEINAKNPNNHQYAPMMGNSDILKSISKYYSPRFNRTIGNGEILITPGAMTGHCNAIIGLAPDKEDQIFSFAPFFPNYLSQSLMAPNKFVTSKFILSSDKKEWLIDYSDLKTKLNKNTKLIMLNSPHNPTGKIFSKEELLILSKIFRELAPNAVILNDCVYESLVFDDVKHHEFASIDNNWERTITLYSAGKLMSCTGHKIGWLIGPDYIIRSCAIIHEAIAFTCNVNSQTAISLTLDNFLTTPEYGFNNYNTYLSQTFKESRDYLVKILNDSKLPIKPTHAQSGYFLWADISELKNLVPKKYFSKNVFENVVPNLEYNKLEDVENVPLDYAVCRWLVAEFGIAPMPGSLFFTSDNTDDNYVRFTICQPKSFFKDVEERLN